MDFIDVLRRFSSQVEKLLPQIQTEEATKISLIMPFFSTVLGYDVFNPDEFVPEFTADVGIKKGEKVDYAIFFAGEPTILIEAKWCGEPLGKHDSQLFRYFGTTKAKLAILTNGVIYKFYTDIDEPNKMDLTPFLELDLLNLRESAIPELKRFCKDSFDADEISSRASELKYSNKIKDYFSEQLREPSDEFVKFIASCVYDGVKTTTVVERFRNIIKSSLNGLINEMMYDRMTTALKNDSKNSTNAENDLADALDDGLAQLIPTDDELLAYKIVKAILAERIDVSEFTHKKTNSYFAILYKDMPTRWICRLRIGGNKGYIGLPNEDGRETRHDLLSVNNIYVHKDNILESAKRLGLLPDEDIE